MSEEVIDTLEENQEVVEEKNEDDTEKDEGFSFSEEVGADELDIDLDSLKISTPSLLGKPKPRPTLTTANESKRNVGRPAKEDEGLWSWCEQFNYTPGVEFLKLTRVWPKQWEGVTIGGYIEEVYEPVDEHWLIERWGGGNYQIDSYQKDTSGRTRKSQTKMVEISGLPKAYMGSDSQIHLFATTIGTQSNKRSADVLRRRVGLRGLRRDNDDFEEEHLDSESRSRSRFNSQRTSNLDQPLTDASTIYKAMQENKKTENEALSVLKEAQKDSISQMQHNAQQQSEMYKTLLHQQKDEMNRLREESRRQAESSSAPFKEMLHLFAAQGQNGSSRENLEVLRSTHDTAIKSLTREHSQHLDDVRKGFESRQHQLMDELNRLRTEFAQDSQRVRTDYLEKERSAKDDAFRTYQLQLDTIKNQSSELRERHRDELSTITRDKNETISQLRQELMEFRTLLQTKDSEQRSILLEERQRVKEEFEKVYDSRVESIKESYKARLDNVQNNADLKIHSAEKESKNAIDAMREKMEQSITFAKKEAKSDANSRIIQLEAQLESLKKEYTDKEKLSLERNKLEQQNAQRERENQRLILESTSQSRQALEEMSRNQLESKIRELNTHVKSLEKQNTDLATSSIPESTDPFVQLEKLNAIKDRLKQHGFISESDGSSDDSIEEKEEKPKDLLGKILHYGPQFVGPILQRIDNATAVAQQAVDQQQQQDLLKTKQELIVQQQQVEQERQLAVQRETGLRERRQMLEERRRLREQQMQEEQYRIQMAQDLERSRQELPQTQEIPEVMEYQELIQQEDIENTEYVEPPLKEDPGDVMAQESSDGYKKLADYLNTAISEKKKAQAIVGELKMARMMNMFSKDTLNSVVSQDFDVLVKTLSSYHPNLKSPKARLILKEVLKGMV